ncbi:MAG: hypothetical protein QOD50_2150 [Actinomycetota bacterium]|jgi:GT2 family glycosyltransferase|nr:hypothetical protein [Actinomycetota bacterium]
MTLDILMPFYGRFDHLRAAVTSVRAQTSDDWRLVVLDDAYPDTEPGQWVSEQDDPRVEYRRNEHNLGVSGTFRLAASLATSEYAVIMGCDDVMLPDYVATVRALAARFPTAAIIQPGVRVIDENGAPTRPLGDRVKSLLRVAGRKPALYGGERLARSLLRGNWTYFPSLCWRVDALRAHDFRTDFDVVLDLALQLEIIASGGSMLVDDGVCFLYRRHAASVSSWKATDGTRFVQEAQLFDESARSFRRLGWNAAARAARLHLTSRLNAALQLPGALLSGRHDDRILLTRHLFGRTSR